MFEQMPLVYYGFHVLGFVATFIYMYFYAKKLELPSWRSILLFSIVYPLVYAFMFIQYWIESGFTAWGNNIVRCFIWIPVFVLPFSKLLRLDFRKSMNLIAGVPLIIHTISHIGCIFEGCCYGYPWEYGIWNPALKERLFPIQMVESVVALVILIIILYYNHVYDYGRKAKAYPLMLMLFGSTRFILEFGRNNEKLFWGISSLAIHAFIMFVVGLLLFIFYDKIFPLNKKIKIKNPEIGVNG